MKKTFLVIAAMAMSLVAQAWEVGDFITNDPTGVPAMVVYVDQTGKHGLMMSPQAFSDKKVQSIKKLSYKYKETIYDKYMFKGGINDYYAYMIKEKSEEERQAFKEFFDKSWGILFEYVTNAPQLSESKLNKNDKALIEGVAPETSESGDENMRVIASYCKNNGLDMAKYFPAFAWAAQLGEGWFIPGNAELELYAQVFTKGMGHANKLNVKERDEKIKQWKEKLGAGGAMFGAGTFGAPAFEMCYPVDGLQSSTMVKSSWGESPEHKAYTFGYVGNSLYYHMRWINRALEFAWWLDFDQTWDNASAEISHVVAFKRF